MKRVIRITESDLERIVRKVIMEQQDGDECIKTEMDELDNLYNGLSGLYGAEYDINEIGNMVGDSTSKKYIMLVMNSLDNMDVAGVMGEFKKLVSLSKLNEQVGREVVIIAGVEVPKSVVYVSLGIFIIGVLSSLLKKVGNGGSRLSSGGSRLSSRAQGCQGASARAKLVRRRRRRESWRSFLVKLGIK